MYLEFNYGKTNKYLKWPFGGQRLRNKQGPALFEHRSWSVGPPEQASGGSPGNERLNRVGAGKSIVINSQGSLAYGEGVRGKTERVCDSCGRAGIRPLGPQ